MKTTKEQKGNIETGRGLVYVGRNGAERYIENPINIYGGVSEEFKNKFYVWNGENLDEVHETMLGAHYEVLPFNSLEEAKSYVDSIKGE